MRTRDWPRSDVLNKPIEWIINLAPPYSNFFQFVIAMVMMKLLPKFARSVVFISLLAGLPLHVIAGWGGGSGGTYSSTFDWPTQASRFNSWLNAFGAQPYAPCGDQDPPIDPTQYRGCPGARSDGSLFGGADIPLQCSRLDGYKFVSVDGSCPSTTVNPDKNLGLSCKPLVSNPINAATGNKVQLEIDYEGIGTFPLRIVRLYNSQLNKHRLDQAIVGANWTMNYGQIVSYWPTMTPNTVHLIRADGNVIEFRKNGFVWISDADESGQLIQLTDSNSNLTGWKFTQSNDTVEEYDAVGKLQTITNRAGLTQTFAYGISSASGGDDDPDTLDTVTGPFGRTLKFSYDANKRIEILTDPENQEYRYAYDTDNNLESVTYPDETPGDPSDNPMRIYHYEDTQMGNNGYGNYLLYPHALTGITNENNDRFATWTYDLQGRAYMGVHAGGVEQTTIDYTYLHDATDARVKVTNPLGKDTTYHLTVVQGVIRVTQVEGHATPSCVGANQNYTYDANGNRDTVTDWKGNVTDLDYDARNLEIQRIEAQGTAEQRTIQTQWHATFRVPTQIDVYDNTGTHIKRTTLGYDSAGRLNNSTETDMASGNSRGISYTYNGLDLLETIDGPRTDVTDITTLAYDTATGNLIQVSNPLGQISQITAHDASGRPQTLVDPTA